jgi:hypothetical protein
MRSFVFMLVILLIAVLLKGKSSPPQVQMLRPQDQRPFPLSGPEVAALRRGQRTPVVLSPEVQTKPSSHVAFHTTPLEGLPPRMKYVPGIRGINRSSYHPRLGPIVGQRETVVFVRDPQHQLTYASNVVYDERTHSLMELSAVLRVRNTDARLREELAAYLDEFYYQAELKLLYVKSSHEHVLELLKELKEKGLDVSFEVIRGYHRRR